MKNLLPILALLLLVSCTSELSYNCSFVLDVVINEDRSKLTVSLDGKVQKVMYRREEAEHVNYFGFEGDDNYYQHIKGDNSLVSIGRGGPTLDMHYCLKT